MTQTQVGRHKSNAEAATRKDQLRIKQFQPKRLLIIASKLRGRAKNPKAVPAARRATPYRMDRSTQRDIHSLWRRVHKLYLGRVEQFLCHMAQFLRSERHVRRSNAGITTPRLTMNAPDKC